MYTALKRAIFLATKREKGAKASVMFDNRKLDKPIRRSNVTWALVMLTILVYGNRFITTLSVKSSIRLMSLAYVHIV